MFNAFVCELEQGAPCRQLQLMPGLGLGDTVDKVSRTEEEEEWPQMRLERQAGQTVQRLVGHIRDFRFHPECMGIKSTVHITAHWDLYDLLSLRALSLPPPQPLQVFITFIFYSFSTYLIFHLFPP